MCTESCIYGWGMTWNNFLFVKVDSFSCKINWTLSKVLLTLCYHLLSRTHHNRANNSCHLGQAAEMTSKKSQPSLYWTDYRRHCALCSYIAHHHVVQWHNMICLRHFRTLFFFVWTQGEDFSLFFISHLFLSKWFGSFHFLTGTVLTTCWYFKAGPFHTGTDNLKGAEIPKWFEKMLLYPLMISVLIHFSCFAESYVLRLQIL